MGGSGKWIKSIIGLKKPDKDNPVCSVFLLLLSLIFVVVLGAFWLCVEVVDGLRVDG